jgi:hypothetical protein
MKNQTKYILLGGLVIGILCAIPLVGWLFPIFAVLGAMLATYLYVKNSPARVETGDGVKLGALTGLAGGVLTVVFYFILQVISVLLVAAMSAASAKNPEDALAGAGLAAGFSAVFQIVYLIITIFCSLGIVLFGLLGGLIGVSVFEKRPSAANYSAQYGNYNQPY